MDAAVQTFTPTRYLMVRRLADGSVVRLGVAVQYPQGWRFTGRVPSRKFHPTMEACLPRWVNYPYNSEARYVEVRACTEIG